MIGDDRMIPIGIWQLFKNRPDTPDSYYYTYSDVFLDSSKSFLISGAAEI